MTDSGSGYVARLFRKALRRLGIRHIRTRTYTPKTKGKAERFIQTLLREWAYAIPFVSSDARAADLPRWLTWYNQQRPHGRLSRRHGLRLSPEQPD
ncbi:transposase [Microvirga sp. BT689]|uniref:integrase core domain-containing protein n=1 Tax=Microvirga arvi TaxID=2778731 RepID=UPI00194F0BD8|nr:integrase core domain-containing protein [Microvirga arvi]MBM6584249.1 transposase [Microvirga arvi]